MWQRRFWNAFHYISHPVALRPANHPKYFLLGFSAALAPKFHPLCITYWLLAVGCWLLAAGCWLLVAGWLLAAGCRWQLAAGQESTGEPR
jgi:predicted tellurium resistance membrane protein TerC